MRVDRLGFDMENKSIFSLVGVCLLLLGGASGLTLFTKAAFGSTKEFHGRETLWGLFIVGVGMGLILVASVR